MKKTISIHIQGAPFLIEEIAFEQLENYMSRLKRALTGQEGAHEIVQDIELRIAELFAQRTGTAKHVINEQDVTDVLITLGDPSDYTDGTQATAEEEEIKEPFYQQDLSERRLFRDTENRYIGGVCAGLGSYFRIDPTIIRIIWALFFFIGGMGLLLYIILWILLPKATSTLDRLKMKGQPINVDSVKEEFSRAAASVSEKSKQFASSVANNQQLKKGTNTFGRVLKMVIGVISLFFAISALIAIISLFFGETQFITASTSNGFLSINSFLDLVLSSGTQKLNVWISVYLTSISYIVFCTLLGIVLLMNIKNKWYKYVNLVLVLLFFIGVGFGIAAGTSIAKDFAEEGELSQKFDPIDTDVLVLNINEDSQKLGEYTIKSKPKWNLYVGKNELTNYGVKVKYTVSKDSLYHIAVEKSANSNRFNEANLKASNIRYDLKIDSNVVTLPTNYSYPKKDKIRAQNLYVTIAIPKGKTVKINDTTIDLQQPRTNEFEDVDFDFYLDEQSGRIKANGSYVHFD